MSSSAPIAIAGLALALLAVPALGKLPALSDEAKAKAAEAAAKAAHNGKVEAFQLCKSIESVAAGYHAQAKKAGKTLAPPEPTPACADPGPFVYTPPVAATAAAAAPAPAAASAPKQ